MVLYFVAIAIYSMVYRACNTKDYEVKVSTLPLNQLWSIEDSIKMKRSAFDGYITNESDLLNIVKHAYQWDKNAMVQYALILDEIADLPNHKEIQKELDDLLDKHKDALTVNNSGSLLKRPDVFDLYFYDFMEKLAATKHPQASMYMIGRVQAMADSPDKRQALLLYIKNALNGGYIYTSKLADGILFSTGSGFKQSHYITLNKITERIPNLPQHELSQAINSYRECAIHGSKYCMMRMSEAYLYGVSVTYTLQMIKELQPGISSETKDTLQVEMDEIQSSIICWDYSGWVSKISDTPAMP